MSITSWKKEFYPIEACNATSSLLSALNNVLLKYIGARKINLKKHKVHFGKKYFIGSTLCNISGNGNTFNFSGATCALCLKYRMGMISTCVSCVLSKIDYECYKPNSAYNKFLRGDPEPMIAILKKLIKEEQQKAKRRRDNDRIQKKRQ